MFTVITESEKIKFQILSCPQNINRWEILPRLGGISSNFGFGYGTGNKWDLPSETQMAKKPKKLTGVITLPYSI